MQPYQEASEEIKRQGGLPFKLAKNVGSVASTAATAYLGGAAASRVLPFLNKYIPEDLAIKGLNKIDPRFGKFINKALSSGQSFDNVKNFISEKIEDTQKKEVEKTRAKDQRNIIEQYSPELHDFLKNQISAGRPALEAGALAQSQDKFKKIIKKLSEDHKTDFSAILQSIYGNEENSSENQRQKGLKQFNDMSRKSNVVDQETQRFENQYGKQNQQQPSQATQNLMAALQAATQARQKRQ